MLSIPEPVWNTMLNAFATAPAGHERVAYLDGVRYRDRTGMVHGVATTVTVPDAVTSIGNYAVSAAAMARAGEHFDILGLVRLARSTPMGTVGSVTPLWMIGARTASATVPSPWFSPTMPLADRRRGRPGSTSGNRPDGREFPPTRSATSYGWFRA